MTMLALILGVVFVALSFPIDGVAGITLALVGAAFSFYAMVKLRRSGGAR